MPTIEERLIELGLTLPAPVAPIATYVPFVQSGSLLIVSGQLCLGRDGVIAPHHTGKLGAHVSLEDAREAAKLCALNLIAQCKAALGSLDRVVRCVRLGGFISVDPSFTAVPVVMNGASDLMVAVFGDKGRHARTTIGVASLPLDACIEVDGMFEVDVT